MNNPLWLDDVKYKTRKIVCSAVMEDFRHHAKELCFVSVGSEEILKF